MSKPVVMVLILLALVGTTIGCGKKDEGDQQKITAPINNSDPKAATAPAAEMGESPGALAARMQGKGGIAKKLGR